MKIGDNGEVWEGEKFTGIRLDGNRLAAVQQIPLARNLMHRLRGFLSTSGAKVFNMTRRFDGGYLQVSSYNGFESAYIFSEDNQPEELIDEGILPQIFSGVTKDSDIIEIEDPDNPFSTVEALRDFKPTDQTWKYIYKKDPDKPTTSFNNEPRLAVRVETPPHQDSDNLDPKTTKTREGDPIPDGEAAQTKEICGSMYSGLMAKAVQVIMGYGKLQSVNASEDHKLYGVKVKYDWRWARCHGIVRGTDGHLWLVEISATNGVIAMPLPVFKNTVFGTPLHAQLLRSKQDVLSKTAKLFNGLPSGGTFPSDINQAILDGDVIRLASVAQMQPFFTKSNYSSWMGWSFNLGGSGVQSGAHNTCFTITNESSYADVQVFTYHYKLEFSITKTKNRTTNQPIGNGSATLSLVTSSELAIFGSASTGPRPVFSMHDGESQYRYKASSNTLPEDYASLPYAKTFSTPLWVPIKSSGSIPPNYKATIIACHIDDKLELVYLERNPTYASAIMPNEVVSGFGGIFNVAPYPGLPSSFPVDTTVQETNVSGSYEINDGYFIRSSYCKEYQPIISGSYNAKNHAQWALNLDGESYYSRIVLWEMTGTETVRSPEKVVAWSAYSRDAFVLEIQPTLIANYSSSVNHETAYTSPETDAFGPGSRWQIMGDKINRTRSHTPYLKYILSTSKKTDADDLYLRYLDTTADSDIERGSVAFVSPGAPLLYTEPYYIYPLGAEDYFNIKHSVFGASAHAVASAPMQDVYEVGSTITDKIVTKGALLATETAPANANYSFVGYIK